MVRRSLLVVTLLAIATPALAQEERVWSSARPDAQAPLGVRGGHVLDEGEFEVTYRYDRLNSAGLWFDNVQLPLGFVAEFYQVLPLAMVSQTHNLGVAVAASPRLTLTANLGFSQRQREHLTSDGEFFFITEADELDDLELSGLVKIFDQEAYRAHLHLGAVVPTGSTEVEAETPFSTPGDEALPYDMRPGAGVFGAVPGLTVMAQNEVATVGAQVRGTVYFGTNDQDFSPGNVFEFNAWASYRANRYIAVSARADYRNWGAVEGADPSLDPLRDPGNDTLGLGGRRLDIPVGFTILMPEGGPLAGHRVSVEYVFPTSHKYDGVQLAADWGLVAAWQVVF